MGEMAIHLSMATDQQGLIDRMLILLQYGRVFDFTCAREPKG